MKLFEDIGTKTKYYFWYLFPFIVYNYYRFKWSYYKKIIIIPHGGLGDIAVLVPALIRLATQFDEINVFCNSEYFEVIKILFKLPTNINSIHFPSQNRKEYLLDTELLKSIGEKGHIIKLGWYGKDPIINFPNCFFLKLGINPKYANEKYDIKLPEFINKEVSEFLKQTDKEYIYVNLTTSEELVSFKNEYKTNLPYVSYDDSALALGVKKFYNVNNLNPDSIHISIINNVVLCLKAAKVIISDAGLFNVVIKFNNCPDLTVVTRNHNHSHNNLLYKIKFNGTIQSCSFN